MKYKILLTIFCSLLLLAPASAQAAVVSFQPQSLVAPQAQPYTLTVVLNTEGENINAIEGSVYVDKALGDVTAVTDSGSVVTFWVKNPVWDPATRSVSFSGTVPGGYQGNAAILFSIVLPSYPGNRLNKAVSFSGVKVYRNDGLGSQAKVSTKDFDFDQIPGTVDEALTEQLYVDPSKIDNIPPEVFSPQLAQDPLVFDGRWFINFSTQDKQTGIDHYEIQETRSGKIDASRWKVVTSPYLLEDQELHSYIYVIAVDRQGNERMIKVFPRNPLSWWKSNGPIAGVVAAIAVCAIVGYVVVRARRKSKTNF
jgi:hypothetical protein